jgi:hypothetical protein
VLSIGVDCDVALLDVVDESFWEGATDWVHYDVGFNLASRCWACLARQMKHLDRREVHVKHVGLRRWKTRQELKGPFGCLASWSRRCQQSGACESSLHGKTQLIGSQDGADNTVSNGKVYWCVLWFGPPGINLCYFFKSCCTAAQLAGMVSRWW